MRLSALERARTASLAGESSQPPRGGLFGSLPDCRCRWGAALCKRRTGVSLIAQIMLFAPWTCVGKEGDTGALRSHRRVRLGGNGRASRRRPREHHAHAVVRRPCNDRRGSYAGPHRPHLPHGNFPTRTVACCQCSPFPSPWPSVSCWRSAHSMTSAHSEQKRSSAHRRGS